MISQDDIDAMQPQPDVHQIQYKIREAFELGYRAGKPDTQKNEWRDAWLDCSPRKWLVDNGMISGMDFWR